MGREFGLLGAQFLQHPGVLRAGAGGGGFTQLGAHGEDAVDQGFFRLPTGLQLLEQDLLFGQRFGDFGVTLAGVDADSEFAGDDVALGLQQADAALAILHCRGRRVLAYGDAGGGGIEQADRLVRQLAGGDVAVRQADGGFDGLVEDLHPVMFFERRGNAAHHRDGLLLIGLVDLDDLEAAGQRRVLLEVFLVFGESGGGDGAQGAAGQRGFEQVRGVAGAGGAAGADQGMGLVDEQDDGLGRGLHLIDDLAEAVLEFALHRGAGLEQADIEHPQADVLEHRGDVAAGDAQGEAFDDGGFADAGLAGEDRVVLAAAHQHVDDLADFVVASGDLVEGAVAGTLGEVDGEFLQRLLLAHPRRGHGAAGFARGGGAVGGGHGGFGRGAEDMVEIVGQGVGLDPFPLARQGEEGVAQVGGLEHAEQQMAGADLAGAEQQGGEDPGALDRLLDLRREVGDRCGATGELVERGGHVGRETRGVDLEMADDVVEVAVLRLHDLVQPMDHFDIGVAAQFAEDSGAFDGAVADGVELAEQGSTVDLGHVCWSLVSCFSVARRTTLAWLSALASRKRSAASAREGRGMSQLVQPRRPCWPSRIGGTSSRLRIIFTSQINASPA